MNLERLPVQGNGATLREVRVDCGNERTIDAMRAAEVHRNRGAFA
jgi:hypothetical protein